MVLQENVKNIMERKEDKRIDIRRNEPREIPHKNNKEKATEIFRPHNYVGIRDWNFYLLQAR